MVHIFMNFLNLLSFATIFTGKSPPVFHLPNCVPQNLYYVILLHSFLKHGKWCLLTLKHKICALCVFFSSNNNNRLYFNLYFSGYLVSHIIFLLLIRQKMYLLHWEIKAGHIDQGILVMRSGLLWLLKLVRRLMSSD